MIVTHELTHEGQCAENPKSDYSPNADAVRAAYYLLLGTSTRDTIDESLAELIGALEYLPGEYFARRDPSFIETACILLVGKRFPGTNVEMIARLKAFLP